MFLLRLVGDTIFPEQKLSLNSLQLRNIVFERDSR